MPVIVDTYNVLHVTGVLHPERAGVDVVGLANLVAGSRFASETVWLVCDGTPRPDVPRGRGRIATVFAGPGRSADEHIGQMIETSTAPRRLTVVSSDLQVGRMARRRRCRWLRAEEFLERLDADAQIHPPGGPRRPMPVRERGRLPLDAREVEQWMRQFGVDESALGPGARITAGDGRSAPAQGAPGGGGKARPAAPQPSASERVAGASDEGRVAPAPMDWTGIDLAGEDLASVDFAAVMEAALAAIRPPARSSMRRRGERR